MGLIFWTKRILIWWDGWISKAMDATNEGFYEESGVVASRWKIFNTGLHGIVVSSIRHRGL